MGFTLDENSFLSKIGLYNVSYQEGLQIMFKHLLLSLSLFAALNAYAEAPCDIRPGTSSGVKVVEFATGNIIHSKISFRESTVNAIVEEMVNLQDMGVCEERIKKQKCVLKFEKIRQNNFITLYRGGHKWNTWSLKSRVEAQTYVKNLKRAGFCS